jgi:ubiquinone/menaquinone biosynthesis C-methylase UbiE
MSSSDCNEAKALYTKRVDAYQSFNSLFRASQAYQAFFESYDRLGPGLRILNAGCGTGIDALALIRALRMRGLDHQTLDAFDLTPAMLARFRKRIEDLNISNVRLKEANVLDLRSLPDDWTHYDLIVSAAMLEYVPRDAIVQAVSGLRARLVPHGTFLLFITRHNWITTILIERPWKANCYHADQVRQFLTEATFPRIVFRKFPASFFWHNLWAHVVEAWPQKT